MRVETAGLIILIALSGCARTSTTQLSQNQILVSTSAAPACSRSSTTRVASQMAAVETLRRGYSRYIIMGANSDDSVQAVSTGLTYANTTGTYTASGNVIHGNSTTTYGGGGLIFMGSRDTDLHVLLLRQGDDGYVQGVDPKIVLGENWPKLVETGVQTCAS